MTKRRIKPIDMEKDGSVEASIRIIKRRLSIGENPLGEDEESHERAKFSHIDNREYHPEFESEMFNEYCFDRYQKWLFYQMRRHRRPVTARWIVPFLTEHGVKRQLLRRGLIEGWDTDRADDECGEAYSRQKRSAKQEAVVRSREVELLDLEEAVLSLLWSAECRHAWSRREIFESADAIGIALGKFFESAKALNEVVQVELENLCQAPATRVETASA